MKEIVEAVVDVPVPHVMKEIVEAVVDVPVPHVMKEIVEPDRRRARGARHEGDR